MHVAACKKVFFSELESAIILKPIIRTLNLLHHNGIVHSDIRMENIAVKMTKRNNLKLQLFDLKHAFC